MVNSVGLQPRRERERERERGGGWHMEILPFHTGERTAGSP